MTKTKRKSSKPVSRESEPLRLNLNLRVKNPRTGQWQHFKSLSFICQAKTQLQADSFARRLKQAALEIAVEMGLDIPGAIYIPKAAENGTTESPIAANPAETRPAEAGL